MVLKYNDVLASLYLLLLSSQDLHRQLQQAHRRMERGSLNGDVISMGSRTSSNNSLNTLGLQQEQAHGGGHGNSGGQGSPIPEHDEHVMPQVSSTC